MVSKLIALSSPLPGSGKSTLAQVLVDDYGFERIPFARVLKAMTCELLIALGYSRQAAAELCSTGKHERLAVLDGVTVRHLLQTLGTEWGRRCVHPELWTRAWSSAATLALNGGTSVVVDDMRFPNELQAVQDLGGLTVRVVRPGLIRGPEASHESEGGLDHHAVDEVLQLPELLPDALGRVMQSYAAALVRKLEDSAALIDPEPLEDAVDLEVLAPARLNQEDVEAFYREWMQREYSLTVKPNQLTVNLVLAALEHFGGIQ